MPVGARGAPAAPTSAIGRAALAGSPAAWRAPATSTSVPHASQVGQRPSHCGLSVPHSVQRCTVRIDRVVMPGMVAPACDTYGGPVHGHTPVVGFDLDMTLIDSRPGIVDTLAALADESDEPALRAPDLLVALLKRNLDLELADRVAPERATRLADRFRELYVDLGVPGSALLPGAAEAVAAVRAARGRVVVVTAKYEPNARRCLDHVGLEVDAVHGWRYGPAKAEALADERAGVYVGDTPRDMEAAAVAGARSVGVTTGPHPASELAAAGAEVVLSSLEEFAAWWHAPSRPG